MTHSDRIAAIVSRFEEAMARFTARLESASAADAERRPVAREAERGDGAPRASAPGGVQGTPPGKDGGWSAAQIAWHVAAVNRSFAAILDGSFPVAKAAAPDFAERAWEEIATGVPDKAEAPPRMQPAGPVTREEALALLAASREKLIAAARALDPDRALLTVDAPLVGCVSLYQVGEWATQHVIRHNRQMKALLT
jgi:hypothetical protein